MGKIGKISYMFSMEKFCWFESGCVLFSLFFACFMPQNRPEKRGLTVYTISHVQLIFAYTLEKGSSGQGGGWVEATVATQQRSATAKKRPFVKWLSASVTSKHFLELIFLHDFINLVLMFIIRFVGFIIISIIKNSFINKNLLEIQIVERVWTT